jgi:hypothetical protein
MATTGQLFYDPVARPLSAVGVAMPNAYYNFYVSGTTNPAQVYQDAALSLPYPASSLNGSSPLFTVVQADGTGAFPPMFLSPTTIYRVQLYNSTWSLVEDVDPYVPSMPVTGNGQMQLDAQGEITINAPVPGGSGITLLVNARSGGTALELVGSGAGSPALIANATVVAGAQTATFTATNKPGSATTAPTKWLPLTCDGATYYIPLWQ